MMLKLLKMTVLVMAIGAATSGSVYAQNYPDKPIKFISATTPGGIADVLARALAESMTKSLGQSIIVDNKPGADQIIGMEYVAKGQPADGYTVMVIGIDGQALVPLIKKNLRFDPLTDLTLVAGLGETRYALAGPIGAPYKNFKELVAAAKANPGKLNYGSSGPQVRFPTIVIMNENGLDMVHIPFAGSGPYRTALVAGTIDWAMIAEGNGNALKQRVRLYAVSGKKRSATNPDLPTFAELGFTRISSPAYALAVRAGTPQAIVDKLSSAAATAIASTEVKAAAQKLDIEVNFERAEAVKTSLDERHRAFEEYVRKGLMKVE